VKFPSEGTCDWIFGHEQFVSWSTAPSSSLLWLHGIPGSGKTILTRHVVEELKIRSLGDLKALLVYHFFDYSGDSTRNSTDGLLRSLLFQLVSQIPNAMSECIHVVQHIWQRSSKLRRSGRKRDQWLANDLGTIFESIVTKISETHELLIIIDGLDESQENEAVRTLSLFSSLQSRSSQNAVRLFVSTRPNAHLEAFRQPHHQKIILQDENRKDIQRFTQMNFEQHLPTSVRVSQILESLVEKAEGIFLWVSLALDYLTHQNDPSVVPEETLSMIPSGLDAVYSKVLDRILHIESHPGGLAKTFLTWVLFSKRMLSIDELRQALDFRAAPLFSPPAIPVYQTSDARFEVSRVDEKWIMQYCWGLVEIHEYQKPVAGVESKIDGQTLYLVRFVHQTAREFLLNADRMRHGSVTSSKLDFFASAHMDLARTCIAYLSFHAFHVESGSTFGISAQKERTYPMLQYATIYWPEHARLAERRGFSHLLLLRNLQWPSTRVIRHWTQLYYAKVRDSTKLDSREWTILHAAAALGLHNLVLAVQEAETSALLSWDIGDATGRTPLSWAAENGRSSTVRLLIQAGADIRSSDTQYGLTPLHWAAAKGHRAAVSLLLDAGADVDDDVGGSTALAIATLRGHHTVSELLLKSGANPNIIDEHYGQAPLHFSAAHGNAAAVSQLLAYGADPSLLDQFSNRTPLYYATIKSQRNVVRLLLDGGAGTPSADCEPGRQSSITWADRVIYALSGSRQHLTVSYPRNPASAAESKKCPPHSAGQAATGSAKESNKATNKRRREQRSSQGGNGDEGSEEDPNKHPTLDSTPPPIGHGPRVRLACPYFKYDPGRYSAHKTCRGPEGWPDVHRLKYSPPSSKSMIKVR
jgi:ankyrin repeat protein